MFGKLPLSFPALAMVLAWSIFVSAAEAEPDWESLIRRDHPRLFFNNETWPAVKARALNEEAQRFSAMQGRIDQVASVQLETRDYGRQAAEAAFVFLAT